MVKPRDTAEYANWCSVLLITKHLQLRGMLHGLLEHGEGVSDTHLTK
jgi:hypothetical protein